MTGVDSASGRIRGRSLLDVRHGCCTLSRSGSIHLFLISFLNGAFTDGAVAVWRKSFKRTMAAMTWIPSFQSRCLRFFDASLRYIVSASSLFEAGLVLNIAYCQMELCGRHEFTVPSGWSSIMSIIVSFCCESNRDRGGVEGAEMATYEYQSAAAILQDQPR